jgi:hypothetical protein
MSLVVVSYPARDQGVLVSIDGQCVPELVDFTLHAAVDDVVRATMRVNATAPMDIQVDAHVTITYNVYPGYEIVETPLDGGGRRIQVRRMATGGRDPEFNE